MKPISAWYFIKENRVRCGLLAFMFVLTYLAYIGGLYATNIQTSCDCHIEAMRDFTAIYARASDKEFKDFYSAVKELENNSKIKLIKQGVVSYVGIKSIMGFENGYNQYSFNSVSDFKMYCEQRGITCDFDNLKTGQVVMSRMAANNRGIDLGDKLVSWEYDELVENYTLGAVTDEEGYWVYYLTEEENLSYIILRGDMTEEEFSGYTSALDDKYDISVIDRAEMEEDIRTQLGGLNTIYAFIVILVAIIMAVTVNAAFVGMYQHRKPEFAIYGAIGISKGQIVRKIAGELMLIDLVGMAAGGALMMIVLYLLNELVLYGQGLWLNYYHPFALMGLLICNLSVLIPMMITRCRQLLKADICEY